MKKLTSLMAMAILALVPFTFAGCNEDDDIADTLWGVWEGDMYIESTWNGVSYKVSESVIQFDKDPYDYARGTGYWVDYYSNAPWDYYATRIKWNVYNGVIEIHSIEDDEYFYISDYSLSDNRFRGTIQGEYGDPHNFVLYKTSSPNWGDFDYGWDYWTGYSYPDYVKAKDSNAAKDSAKPTRGTVKSSK